MSEEQAPHAGDGPGELSRTVVRRLVAAVKQHYGKGPETARAHFVEDDVLVVVMREPATTAERTMASAGREEEARQFRLAFQKEYGQHLCAIVEEVTGRRVATYHSQIMFDPDMLFEIFVFDPSRAAGPAEERVDAAES